MFLKNTKLGQARKKEITIDSYLWKYVEFKSGNFPLKLKVTFNRKTKFYPIQVGGKNVFLSPDEFNTIVRGKTKGELHLVKNAVEQIKYKAKTVCDQIITSGFPFTFIRFENLLFANEVSSDFMEVFKKYLDDLFAQNRFGTYRSYLCAYNNLKNFLGPRTKLSPYDITVDFLNEFEAYLRTERSLKGQGKRKRSAGITTIGIYTRNIRTIYNVCASRDFNLKEVYPFGRLMHGRYRIKNSRKGSKQGGALSSDELKKFIDSTPDRHSPMYEAKMYWLFSFYCQGMNFKDISYLKYSNIKATLIQYTRRKTQKTEEEEIIEIPLNDSIREIIIKLGNEDKTPENYVFPIIDQTRASEYQIEKDILHKTGLTNKWLKRLCKEIGISEVTTYWGRHTYASLLKYSGVPVEMIRELLGHSDIKTTEHYLKRFDLESKRLINDRLIQNLKLN